MPNAVELNAAEDCERELQLVADAALRGSGYPALSFIGCEVRDGEIILEGRVPTFHLKQLAQAVIQQVVGAVRLDNRLAVGYPGETKRRTP